MNKVILVGRLGGNPEERELGNNQKIVNVSLATSETWKDKNTGEKVEKTEWHRLVMFNKLADIAAQYLQKGSQILVDGSIRTNKWQDKEGNNRYTTEIIVKSLEMLCSKGSSNNHIDSQVPAVIGNGFGSDDIPF